MPSVSQVQMYKESTLHVSTENRHRRDLTWSVHGETKEMLNYHLPCEMKNHRGSLAVEHSLRDWKVLG